MKKIITILFAVMFSVSVEAGDKMSYANIYVPPVRNRCRDQIRIVVVNQQNVIVQNGYTTSSGSTSSSSRRSIGQSGKRNNYRKLGE